MRITEPPCPLFTLKVNTAGENEKLFFPPRIGLIKLLKTKRNYLNNSFSNIYLKGKNFFLKILLTKAFTTCALHVFIKAELHNKCGSEKAKQMCVSLLFTIQLCIVIQACRQHLCI